MENKFEYSIRWIFLGIVIMIFTGFLIEDVGLYWAIALSINLIVWLGLVGFLSYNQQTTT